MKLTNIILINKNFKDLNPVDCGNHICAKGHSYGPRIREYCLLHYVEKGKGILEKGGKTYPVHENQMFVILPGEVTTYTADEEEPWVYSWVGFTGELAERFSELPPVVDIKTNLFSRMQEARNYKSCREEFLASYIFRLYCELFSDSEEQCDYVRQVCDYISSKYNENISICHLAETIGLERSYLSRMFKKKMGISIQEYLINVRMEHAEELLKAGFNVSQTARMCGYEDQFNFSKMFKKKFGISPKKSLK